MKTFVLIVCAAFALLSGSAAAQTEKCRLGAEVPRQVRIPGTAVIIFKDSQCFGIYENGRIAYREVAERGWYVPRPIFGWASTGSAAHQTPRTDHGSGPQRVLWSSRDHRSREIQIQVKGKWVDAPMPYALFFDDRGRAIHAGNVRRERASHGCVRIPMEAARVLFDEFRHDTLQIIIVHDRADLRRSWENGYFSR